ncbi:MAG: XdhC family protein [Mycobacterium sp.]|jgi:xanthine dehydrogenase accessory factor
MDIAERARQLRNERKPFVHATVVRAQHPTSAQAGDQAILLSDGTIEGFVGGQCARDSVRKAAMGALQAGESVLLRVLPDGDVHFPDAPGACVVVNPCLSGGALEIFLAPQIPAPLVRIVGETPVAEALAQVCTVLGYDVRRDDSGFDGTTAVVIATHGGPEAETVRAALDAGVGYIGLVASAVRGASVVDMLELSCCERGRVHTPVGLPIGAKTPAEIAVSIAAEMISGIRSGGLTVPEPTAGAVQIDLQPAAPPADRTTAVDPVCGMTVTIAAGTPQLQVDGQDYWFCCPGCRTRFAAQAVT